LRQFHLTQSGWLHFALFNQPGHDFPVSFGPLAFGATRCKALQPELLVVAAFLAIDPAITQRAVKRLIIGNGGDPCGFFGQLEPKSGRSGMVFCQPCLPRLGRSKRNNGQIPLGFICHMSSSLNFLDIADAFSGKPIDYRNAQA
jgi:hypothetical protein